MLCQEKQPANDASLIFDSYLHNSFELDNIFCITLASALLSLAGTTGPYSPYPSICGNPPTFVPTTTFANA